MYHTQRLQQKKILGKESKYMTEAERASISDDLLINLQEELTELTQAVREKPHVRPERRRTGNVTDAVVDLLKLTYSIADLYGISERELEAAFQAKTELIYQRVEQYKLELSNSLVFVTDLDGCVADIQPFVDKFEGGTPYKGETGNALDRERAVFDWYEAGGFKDLPPIPGARETLTKLRERGVKIAVISARPAWEHHRLASDTTAWLNKHQIPHDILVFEKDKHDALVKHVYPAQVMAFVEDRDKHAIELANRGVRVLLMDTPSNRTIAGPTIHRVRNWAEIDAFLEEVNWGVRG
jgi:NTP pyrophosphatase (non-canonical NTP hydrolase)